MQPVEMGQHSWLTCCDRVEALLRDAAGKVKGGCTGTHILQVAPGLLPQPLQLSHWVIQARKAGLQTALRPHRCHLRQ